jgi:diguanylate cyclase (GGDEF)-like protein/PAS domain S-box-containing protein
MESTYSLPLVALSVVIAILASYTALALAGRVTITRGASRVVWLLCGSIAMGSGIWSMHFVAMLAFRLPVAVAYDVPIVALSLVAAIGVSLFALLIASHPSVGTLRLAEAGAIMGGGIATMHYTGMAAMRMHAHLGYNLWLVALSGVIAISASTVALWMFRRLRSDNDVRGTLLRGAAAVILGFAIAGLHYTAMTAAHFAAVSGPAPSPHGVLLATRGLASMLSVATILILVLTLLGSVVDHRVRARLAAAEALRQSEERYRTVVSEVHEVIFSTDKLGRWIFLNPAWTAITGFTQQESLGMALSDFVPAEDRDEERAAFLLLANGTANECRREVLCRTKSGGTRWLEANSRVNRDAAGALVGTAGTLRDITQRRFAEEALREAEERLVQQALHDPLTGLANRTLFRDRVQHSLARVERGERVAVLLLDLDNFKDVNDSWGHIEGDRLLESVATRLLKSTRGFDTVARLGGDEFAILLEDLSNEDDVTTVIDRIMPMIRKSIVLQGRDISIDASIGVAHVRLGQTVDDVLRNADLAMYRAKASGKGSCVVFEPGMHAAVLERIELEADLRVALERDEFSLVYQPIVELGSGTPIGVEALLRWRHPLRGMVSPAVFIPLAEASGLIVPIGKWVLREALRQIRGWMLDEADGQTLAINVNLSGRQLQEPGVVSDVADALAESGVEPECLTLEITESVLMQDTDSSLATLKALKSLGVKLAIDDFGTGYSSLSYLHRFPIDVLKIDKSFIDGVARNGSDAALARTIVKLAGMLNLSTVAEGVENADQRAHLAKLGCLRGQGYLFARPLEPREMGMLLRGAGRAQTASVA